MGEDGDLSITEELPPTPAPGEGFFCFLFFFLIFIGTIVDLQCCVISGVQQSESVIHVHISTLLSILFPYKSLQSTE